MSDESTPQLILASASPRRRALLDQIGVRYQAVAANILEIPGSHESPEGYVLRIAEEKSLCVLKQPIPALPVLAADTEVVLDGEIFGKPEDPDAAYAMVKRLSGRSHEVLTGISVRNALHHESRLIRSLVTFRPLEDLEIKAYIQYGEPFGKAGGYAIQGLGALFVSRLEGSFSGVMGLPLEETGQLLNAFGINPLKIHHERPSP